MQLLILLVIAGLIVGAPVAFAQVEEVDDWVPFTVTENAGSITVEGGYVSFVVDEQSCTARLYEPGPVHESRVVLDRLNYLLNEAPNGVDVWVDSDINSAQCNISVVEDPNNDQTVSVFARQFDGASVKEIEYRYTHPTGLETFLRYTETNIANNNIKYGFTEVITDDGIFKIDETPYFNSTFGKAQLKNVNQVSKDIMIGDLIYNPKDQTHDRLWEMKIFDGQMVIDFNNSPGPLGTGNTLEIDPQYTFIDALSISAEGNTPRGISWNDDGTKLYIVGQQDSEVNEYACTAYDASSCTYTDRLALASPISSAKDVSFNTDGTKMFVSAFNSTGDGFMTEYACTAYDASTCTVDSTYYTHADNDNVQGHEFNADGTKLFIVASTSKNVGEYTLSTGFDISSTVAYVDSFDATAYTGSPTGLGFSSDGLWMYTTDSGGTEAIQEYILGTAWDVSTSVYVQEWDISAQDGSPSNIALSADDELLFMVGSAGKTVNEYAFISAAPPFPPPNITASATSSAITVLWDEVTHDGGNPVTSYTMLYSISDAANVTDSGLAVTPRSYTNSGLGTGTTIDYYLSACNTDGCSPYSTITSMTTLAAAVDNLNATVTAADVVRLDWDEPFVPAFEAVGGTITTDGSYTIHTFTSSGFFNITNLGAVTDVEFLVLGGGAGGGYDAGGGGGAGGYRVNSTFPVTVQDYAITVGTGGAGGTSSTDDGDDGTSSTFDTITSAGGGGGGSNQVGATGGNNGASGGGANGNNGGGFTGGTATPAGQGTDGGDNLAGGTAGTGGGGGSGTIGISASVGQSGGGGNGTANSINGTSIYYGGGGGGAESSFGAAKGLGGIGGGGDGSDYPAVNPEAGTDGLGGGGGGGDELSNGADGGDGIVIIRYLDNNTPVDVLGYKIFQSDDSGVTYSVIANDTGPVSETYDATGLTVDTEYYFKVGAWTLGGVGANATVSTTTFGFATEPLNLTANTFSTTQINLNWTVPLSDGGNPITGYKVFTEAPIGNGWTTLIADTGNNNTYYNATGRSTGSVHNFKVAVITLGVGANSTAVSNSTIPVQVTGMSFTAATTTTLTLDWSDTSGDDIFYKVERESPTGGGFSTIVANQTASVIADTGLTAGTEYNYRLTAFNQGGDGVTNTLSGLTQLVPPTALIVTPISTTQLDLAWTAPVSGSPNGYKIERESPVGGGWSVLVANTTTTAVAYSNTGISSNTEYNYRVSALQDVYESDPTTAVSGITLPGPASSLVVSVVSSTQIDLVWTAPTGGEENGYKIERASPVGGGWATINANTTNTNIYYNNTGLTSNTEYQYRVTALNPSGASTTSNTDDVFTLFKPPTSLTATTFNATMINLAWTAPSPSTGLNGYKIERETGIGGGWSTIVANTTTTNVTYANSPITAGTTYNYRVSALAGTNGGEPSNTAANTTNTNAPGNFTVSAVNSTGLLLDWTAPSGTITGYKIESESPVGGGWAVLVNDTGTTDISYNHNGLSVATQYNYRIYAHTTVGTSDVTLAVANYTISGPPQNLRLTAISSSAINLDWDAPAASQGLNGYKIEREAPAGSGWSTLVANTTNTQLYYNDTGLSIIYYNYRVTSLALNGESVPSNEEALSPTNFANSVVDLIATAIDFDSVLLSFTTPPNTSGQPILGYQINYTTPVGDPLTILSNSSNTFTITGLNTYNNTYSFRLGTVTAHGINSTYANIANTTTGFNLFTIGTIDLTPTGDSPQQMGIDIDSLALTSTSSLVTLTYDSAMALSCDFDYKFAKTSATYGNLTETPVTGSTVTSDFTILNSDNEVIEIECTDTLGTESAKHQLNQMVFPLLTQVTDFQSGNIPGTEGDFGALDLMTLMILIVLMIAFNRTNPAVGIGIMIIGLGATSYFGFIQLETLITGVIALILVLAITRVRSNR